MTYPSRRTSGRHARLAMRRRDFLLGAVAAGSSSLAFPAWIAEARAAIKNGGRLRIGCTGGSTNDTLDPALILDVYMSQVSFGQLRNGLTEVSADGTLVPELAESWESSPDARSWTFKIRKSVTFHNGKPLTSADVVASINHHRTPESKSAVKDIVKPIVAIKADGDQVVVMTLADSNADFPYLLSAPHLGICPAADGKIDWQSGVGTGGYVLSSFEPGKRTLTRRNPNYWKQGAAHFDEVETLFIADVTARTNALTAGEIDVMNKADVKTLELLKQDPTIKVIVGESNQHVALPMDARAAPFNNNEVRLALKYAVNRQEILDKIFAGYGTLGNDYPIGAANRYHATAEEIPQRPFDPDQAKFHLRKAGLSNLNIQFSAADTAFAGAVDTGLLISAQAKQAGINIEVIREANDGYWDNVWLKKPWCASFWAGRPTEDWMFTQVYSSGAAWNESHWENERFNTLLKQGRSELDDAKRRQIYIEMQRILSDEGSTIIPLFAPYIQAASTKIALPERIGNNFELDGYRCAERWSFA